MKRLAGILMLCVIFFLGACLTVTMFGVDGVDASAHDQLADKKVEKVGVRENVVVEEKAIIEPEHHVVEVNIRMPKVISRVDCFPPQPPSE